MVSPRHAKPAVGKGESVRKSAEIEFRANAPPRKVAVECDRCPIESHIKSDRRFESWDIRKIQKSDGFAKREVVGRGVAIIFIGCEGDGKPPSDWILSVICRICFEAELCSIRETVVVRVYLIWICRGITGCGAGVVLGGEFFVIINAVAIGVIQ